MKKIVKSKKGMAWFWLVPMVVPLWIMMFGQVKLLFVDWGALTNKIIIMGGIIIVVMIIFKRKE